MSWMVSAAVALAIGCGIDPEGRLQADGGRTDSFIPGVDAGPIVREDSGEKRVDGGPAGIDGGPTGGPDAGPAPSCEAGTSRCSPDGTVRLDCVDGFTIDSQPCSRGCDPATDDCRPLIECTAMPPLLAVPSDHEVDTCGLRDDHRFEMMDTCDFGYPADGEDAMVRFELDRPTVVRLLLRDADTSNALDAVLYVRQGGCLNGATQIACDDDGGDAIASRAALIERRFEAGEYFVILDIFDDSGAFDRCGNLRLEITVP